jgi:hypothetical protein
MNDPRMSPLHANFHTLSPADQAALVAAYTPVPPLVPGATYQVAADGRTLTQLAPGALVPTVPVVALPPVL